MHAAAHRGDFGIGMAQDRIELAGVDVDLAGQVRTAVDVPHKAARLPGLRPAELFGEALRDPPPR